VVVLRLGAGAYYDDPAWGNTRPIGGDRSDRDDNVGFRTAIRLPQAKSRCPSECRNRRRGTGQPERAYSRRPAGEAGHPPNYRYDGGPSAPRCRAAGGAGTGGAESPTRADGRIVRLDAAAPKKKKTDLPGPTATTAKNTDTAEDGHAYEGLMSLKRM